MSVKFFRVFKEIILMSRKYILACYCILIVIIPLHLCGQQKKSDLSQKILFSGTSNIYGEYYNASGISNRRPPTTGRISLNPNLQILNLVSLSMQMLVSTEGTQTRQNMNILGLHPRWEWGYAHLGDFSDNYSQHSLSGINVKGAEIAVFPKNIRFSVGGGQTRRAVDDISINESYDQYTYFSKLGYGDENRSFFDLIFLKVKDDPESVKKPADWDYTYIIPDTMENILDTIWVEPPYNPVSVTPQENMVMGINSRIAVFQQKVVLELEASGSAFNKDLNADKVAFDDTESVKILETIYSDLFTPRAGSSFDYAINSSLNLNLQRLKLRVSYRHIGPGYVSLGTPSNINDRREFQLRSNFKIMKHRIRASWNRMTNNLSNQKLETNIRNQYQLGVYSMFENWRSNINFRYLGMDNVADYDSLEWDYGNINFSTHQSMVFGKDNILRQVGFQYRFQGTDKNMTNDQMRSQYHTLNLTASFRLPHAFTMNSSIGISQRNSDDESSFTQVYSLRLNHITLENKLTNSIFVSSNIVRDTKMFRAGMNSLYNVGKGYRLNGNIFYNLFNGQREYKELRSSIRLSYQF